MSWAPPKQAAPVQIQEDHFLPSAKAANNTSNGTVSANGGGSIEDGQGASRGGKLKMSGQAQKQGAKTSAQDTQTPTKSIHSASSTNNSTVNADGGIAEDGQEPSRGGSDRSAGSPEPNCAICLGTLENKSFTDSCFHMFCFVCLQEWSKVKPECPLCKQPFKSIIHNVKSYNNYDQFYLDHHSAATQPMRFGWNFERSFRYRTTMTMDHGYINLQLPPFQSASFMDHSLQRPSRRPSLLPSYRLRSRAVHPWTRGYSEPVSTTDFRRRIYEIGRRVTGVRTTHRRRTVTPQFFCANPAQTHRLIPWLNRELNALLYNVENQVTFVLELILDLIKRFPIDSEEFYEHIRPYFRDNTRHFMHEFLAFARSPYTMQTYDTKAIYAASTQTVSSSDSSSNDSDVVVVDDDDAEEAGRPQQNVSIAAEPPSPCHGMQLSSHRWQQQNPDNFLDPPSTSFARSGWDSPTPGPSWDLGRNSSHSPVNVDDSSDSSASTIIDPAYISPITMNAQESRFRSPNDSDGEEVIFVSYDKPWEERSPIQLSSGSDDEALSKFAKKLKREHKRKKTGASETLRHSRSRRRELSRSLTPPAAYRDRSRSPYVRASTNHDHQHTSSSRRSKQQDKYYQRKHHTESMSEPYHSSRSSRKEKHRHSSHSRAANRKRHDRPEGDSDRAFHDSSHKKHKKKHKKNKDKRRRHVSHNDKSSTYNTFTSVREESDRCKKHPSGHKKSRVHEMGEGSEREGRANHHNSDGLMSDTSTSSSSSSTITTVSVSNRESSSASCFSREQRVQQVLQERQQTNLFPLFPNIDISPSWENITRLANFLASHPSSQMTTRLGPSHHSSGPVVICNSSDESDYVERSRSGGKEQVSCDNMHVAKTVVVPCNPSYGVATAAIDLPAMTMSTSASQPNIVDEYIDVDSISSVESVSDCEILDVESLDDTEESSTDVVSSGDARETRARSKQNEAVAEVSTEIEWVSSPTTLANRKTPIPAVQAHPFSIQSILNRDVFMGTETSSQSLSRQASSTSSQGTLNFSQENLTSIHSQPQTSESSTVIRHGSCEFHRQHPSAYVSKLEQLLRQRSHNGGQEFDQMSLRSLFAKPIIENNECHEMLTQNKVGALDTDCGTTTECCNSLWCSSTAGAGMDNEDNAQVTLGSPSKQRTLSSLNQTLAENGLDDAHLLDDEEIDVVNKYTATDECRDRSSTDDRAPSQDNNGVVVQNTVTHFADITEGPCSLEQSVNNSPDRAVKTPVLLQTAADSGKASLSPDCQARIFTTTVMNSAEQFTSSPDYSPPSSSAEMPHTSVGDDDTSTGDQMISVSGTQSAHSCEGDVVISAKESDTCIGDPSQDDRNADNGEAGDEYQCMDNLFSNCRTENSTDSGIETAMSGSAEMTGSSCTESFEQGNLGQLHHGGKSSIRIRLGKPNKGECA